jgi:hypothetical protein
MFISRDYFARQKIRLLRRCVVLETKVVAELAQFRVCMQE